MSTLAVPQNNLRPFILAVLVHGIFAMLLTLAQLYQKAIPKEREYAPLEVVVIGNLDIEDVQMNSRMRTTVQDLREGIVIAEPQKKSKAGDIAAVAPSGDQKTGKLGGILSMTQQLGKQGSGGDQVGNSELAKQKQRMALAVVEKSLRDDFIKGSGKSEDASGLQVVNRIPEKVKGIEWKQVQKPTVKAPSNLSPDEIEKLRLYFSTKWIDIRDCYERALQFDEKLSGYVNLQVQIGKSNKAVQTVIDFKGDGNPASQKSLKSCLSGVADSMIFFEKLNGQTVQVGYRLTS